MLDIKEKEVVSLTSLQSQNNGEVDVLNTLIQSKEKQIASLKEKVGSITATYEFSLINCCSQRIMAMW